MTPRERLLTVLSGGIPDRVPVAPDISNMVPARLTGKPFWDLYLYNDPPIWEAYLAAARRFGIDSLMDGYFPLRLPHETPANEPPWETFLVHKDERLRVTQRSYVDSGRRVWAPTVDVHYVADPPTHGVAPRKVHLPETPSRWEPLEGVRPVDLGPSGLKRVKQLMGDSDLAELKRLHGRKLTLKGNLHTTDVMLHGSPADVIRAAVRAMDDAAEGGRFILSTGDQCGRDTPDENLRALVHAAQEFGVYDQATGRLARACASPDDRQDTGGRVPRHRPPITDASAPPGPVGNLP